MKRILSAEEIQPGDRHRVGGKGYALSLLVKRGFRIPRTVCITTDMYREYVRGTGLRERILLELHRKDLKEMRWEEIWDCATRIRNMFLIKPIPEDLAWEMREGIATLLGERTVAVRSSAPGEDDAQSSFAGLHESFVNVTGAESILKHIRMVWSSLWSDAALLYRQEIGLDVEESSMAVLVQEAVVGDRSGMVFTRNPNDEDQGVVESVYGLNQGLVDGTVEPDRWIMDRLSNRIVVHTPPERKYWMIPGREGVRLFGQVYNDALEPDDPYEFLDLLTSTGMASLERNNMLMELAATIRSDEHLAAKLKQGDHTNLDARFLSRIDEFMEKFGGLPCITGIPDATTLIQTGDEITVDGYLGIVTIGDTGI
jgi:phosphoenolpyruvate synthase/pyruvate phosphate dikinase